MGWRTARGLRYSIVYLLVMLQTKYETTYMSEMVLQPATMEMGDWTTSETMRGASQMGGGSNLPRHYPKTESQCRTGTHFCVPVDVCVPLKE
jgi:hypothetical protein